MKSLALLTLCLVVLSGCASQDVGPTTASVKGSYWERKGGVIEEGIVPRQIAISAVDGHAIKKPSATKSTIILPGNHVVDVVYTRESRYTDKLNRTQLAFGKIKWTAVAGESYVVKGDDYNFSSVVRMWIERLSDGRHASGDVDVRKTVDNIHWR